MEPTKHPPLNIEMVSVVPSPPKPPHSPLQGKTNEAALGALAPVNAEPSTPIGKKAQIDSPNDSIPKVQTIASGANSPLAGGNEAQTPNSAKKPSLQIITPDEADVGSPDAAEPSPNNQAPAQEADAEAPQGVQPPPQGDAEPAIVPPNNVVPQPPPSLGLPPQGNAGPIAPPPANPPLAQDANQPQQPGPIPAGDPIAPPLPPAPPLVLEDELAKMDAVVEQLVADPTSNGNSQGIIKNFLSTFKKFPNDYAEPVVVAQLQTNAKGQFDVEPYRENDEICYRIRVKYTVTAQSINSPDVQDKTLEFYRTISTNCTTPQDAIAIANNFKFTVVELAKKGAGMPNEFSGADDEFENAANTAKTFSFKCSYKDNRISTLRTIQVISAGKDKTYSVKPSQKKYVYNPKNHSYYPAKPNLNPKDLAGHMIFDTKLEAMLYTKGYQVNHDNLYNELEKENRFSEHIKNVKAEIKQKETEFANLKATFTKAPLFKLFKRSGFVKETEQIQIDTEIYKDILKGKGVSDADLKKLSPNMKEFANLKKELESNKANQASVEKNLKEDLDKLDQKAATIANGPLSAKEMTELKDFLRDYNVEDAVLNDATKSSIELVELGKKAINLLKTNLAKEIAAKENQISKLQKNITDEQENFHKRLGRLQKINEELKMNLDQLKVLKEKADLKVQGNLSKEQKKQATSVVKSVGNIKSYEDSVKNHDQEIEKLKQTLKFLGDDVNQPQLFTAYEP